MIERRLAALFAAGAVVVLGTVLWLRDDPGSAPTETPSPAATSAPTPTVTPDPTPVSEASSTTEPEKAPGSGAVEAPDPGFDEAMAVAAVLGETLRPPSDCGSPLDDAVSLPNSPREYRSGVHQGIDFICGERGHVATAALPGRVVFAVGDHVEPDPAERDAILDATAEVGATPRYTLLMLYGNFVVVDHGVVAGAGHVVSVYAHLDSLDPAAGVGRAVEAGAPLGEIGNTGTSASSSGQFAPRSLHLHWELHVDGRYLGAGLDPAETRAVYAELLGT